jgi:tungstate transport system substrate-binding protein
MCRRLRALSLFLSLLLLAAFDAVLGPARAGERSIVLASTTSTENSGLLGRILPLFEAASGIRVKVVAVGTGQALKLAERGDADVLLIHHRPSEDAFVAAGFGLERRDVMANDYVLVGPAADPAGVRGERDVVAALRAIATARAIFVSRGDDSGTHKLEQELWQKAGIEPRRAGSWYREAGSGMGATLNTAAGLDAYTLADRASWATFANKRTLAVMVEGDPALSNPYGVILVNPARHPHVRFAEARAFVDWLTGPEGQAAIAAFTVAGQRLFLPTASAASRGGS